MKNNSKQKRLFKWSFKSAAVLCIVSVVLNMIGGLMKANGASGPGNAFFGISLGITIVISILCLIYLIVLQVKLSSKRYDNPRFMDCIKVSLWFGLFGFALLICYIISKDCFYWTIYPGIILLGSVVLFSGARGIIRIFKGVNALHIKAQERKLRKMLNNIEQ